MWLYRTRGDAVQPIVLYDYQPDRRSKRPAVFLKDFKGYLHTDGYEGYHSLRIEITVVGCWAHVRRKFDEALKALPERDREGSNALHGKRNSENTYWIFCRYTRFFSPAGEPTYALRSLPLRPFTAATGWSLPATE